GVSLVQRLATPSPRCKARNGAALAPTGLAHILAPAFTPHRAARPPPNCAGTSDPHPPDDHGEPPLGSAEDPVGAGEAWIQSVSQNGCQVYATNPSSRAVHHLAVIPEAPCDFFCVRTITFRTLYVFFVIDHASRQVLHVEVTPNPTATGAAQQMAECCAWDRRPPRFLVRDRDSCYGTAFDRRVRNIGVAQVRTPFRAPRANAIAERWVRSVRTECLDHVFIFNERHLQKVLAEYVGYFNDWRPHRSLGQRAPCAPLSRAHHRNAETRKIIAIPVLGGLHHVYQQSA